jgi:hypothetical protein
MCQKRHGDLQSPNPAEVRLVGNPEPCRIVGWYEPVINDSRRPTVTDVWSEIESGLTSLGVKASTYTRRLMRS